MRRGVGLLVICLLAAGMVAGSATVASANHNGEGGGAASEPVGTPTGNTSENMTNTSIVTQVDNDVAVLSYSYDADKETMTVRLQNDGTDRAEVTLTEIVNANDMSGDKSALTFGIEMLTMRPHSTVSVEVDVADRGRMAGVTVVTRTSAEAGSGKALTVDLNSGIRLIRGEASGGDVRSGVFFGGFGALMLAGAAAWQRKATRNADVKDARLKPKLNVWGVFRDDD